MIASLAWGALAAGSLLLGAVISLLRRWGTRPVGLVLGFGAGALVASISFELAEEAVRLGGAVALALGLAAGALAFFFADRIVARLGARSGGGAAGLPLALGALLDGIPEQAVLGIGLAGSQDVSAALLVAIVVSNLPEAIGSSADMLDAGKSRRFVVGLWGAVTAVCAMATGFGYLLAGIVDGTLQAVIDGFAAGALLVMLMDSMVPEAKDKAGDFAGLTAVMGFALGAVLSLTT